MKSFPIFYCSVFWARYVQNFDILVLQVFCVYPYLRRSINDIFPYQKLSDTKCNIGMLSICIMYIYIYNISIN